MAKINVVADAIVVTSSLKLEDIQLIEKYRPEELVLKGGEEGKEPIFKLSTGDNGAIGKYGACFSGETRDDDKLATITMVGIYADGVNVAEAVADELGGPIMMLNKLEATLPEVIEAIAAEKEAIMAAITVA